MGIIYHATINRMKQAHFSIKYQETLGERLVVQNARYNPYLVELLSRANLVVPGTITVGYYQQLDNPAGAWCFMPVDTPQALAILPSSWVMSRVADDLIFRIGSTGVSTKGYQPEGEFTLQQVENILSLDGILETPELINALYEHELFHMPASHIIGYFRRLHHPPGAWAFMPTTMRTTIAMLTTELVQSKISEGLIQRILVVDRYNTKDPTPTDNPRGSKETVNESD